MKHRKLKIITLISLIAGLLYCSIVITWNWRYIVSQINLKNKRFSSILGYGTTDVLYDQLWITDGCVYGSNIEEPFTGRAFEINANGRVLSYKTFKNGKKDGLCGYFFSNKKIWRQEEFKKGLPHGDWFYHNNAGHIIARKTYKNGKLVKVRQFYDNGLDRYIGEYDEKGNLQNEIFLDKNRKILKKINYQRTKSVGVGKHQLPVDKKD